MGLCTIKENCGKQVQVNLFLVLSSFRHIDTNSRKWTNFGLPGPSLDYIYIDQYYKIQT